MSDPLQEVRAAVAAHGKCAADVYCPWPGCTPGRYLLAPQYTDPCGTCRAPHVRGETILRRVATLGPLAFAWVPVVSNLLADVYPWVARTPRPSDGAVA